MTLWVGPVHDRLTTFLPPERQHSVKRPACTNALRLESMDLHSLFRFEGPATYTQTAGELSYLQSPLLPKRHRWILHVSLCIFFKNNTRSVYLFSASSDILKFLKANQLQVKYFVPAL